MVNGQGKRCHPPLRRNKKTNVEVSANPPRSAACVLYRQKLADKRKNTCGFCRCSFFRIKSDYFCSADEYLSFYVPSALFFKLTPYRIFRSVIVEEFFSIAVKHSHLVDLVYGWSETQIFPRTVAHISLKKRREVLRYLSLSKYTHRFGRISCSAFFMARYSSMSASISLFR